MHAIFKCYLPTILPLILLVACQPEAGSGQRKTSQPANETAQKQAPSPSKTVQLSAQKFANLGLKVDSLPRKQMDELVQANGHLKVPPQHEAAVTAVLGGNVTAIEVIEGDPIRKGAPLAYLAHPDLSNLQARYVKAYQQESYLRQKYQRQQKLYEKEVTSGEKVQQARAEYLATQAQKQALAAQLKQLNLNLSRIQEGQLYDQIPVMSPIKGHVEKVLVKLGQYVDATTEMFLVVNTEHVHADFMIFEEDVHKVKVDQKVSFTLQDGSAQTHQARIYSVGRKFEQNPKALHVHAELLSKNHAHIPGMYIQGHIQTGHEQVPALPDQALATDDGKTYIFTAQQGADASEWLFEAVEVKTGARFDGWTEVRPLKTLPRETQYLWNGAYALISEMKKSQASGGH